MGFAVGCPLARRLCASLPLLLYQVAKRTYSSQLSTLLGVQQQGPGYHPGAPKKLLASLSWPVSSLHLSSKFQAQHTNELFFQPLHFELPGVLFLRSVVQRIL